MPTQSESIWHMGAQETIRPSLQIGAGKRLVRIVAMLTKLLMRFDPEQYRVHESAAGLASVPSRI